MIAVTLRKKKKGHFQSNQHWNCLKGNTGETPERRGGVHNMGFPEHIIIWIPSWTELNWTEPVRDARVKRWTVLAFHDKRRIRAAWPHWFEPMFDVPTRFRHTTAAGTSYYYYYYYQLLLFHSTVARMEAQTRSLLLTWAGAILRSAPAEDGAAIYLGSNSRRGHLFALKMLKCFSVWGAKPPWPPSGALPLDPNFLFFSFPQFHTL